MYDDNGKGEHHGTGHRSGFRKGLLAKNGESLHYHELVEYLLALAIPRRDKKQVAKDLLVRYGSLSALLTADADSILQEKWMGETSVAALKIVQVAALRLLSEPIRELPILASWQSLLDYLRADMAHLTIERVRTLYLNSKNMLIRDEVASEGSVDQAPAKSLGGRWTLARRLSYWFTTVQVATACPAGRILP